MKLSQFNWRAMAALCLGAMMAVSFTACDDDDDDEDGEDPTLDTKDGTVNFDGLKITADANGGLTFSGTVQSTKTITKFYLTPCDKDGKEKDGAKKTELTGKDNKTKIEGDYKYAYDCNGTVKAEDGPFLLTFDTRLTAKQKIVVGKEYTFDMGTGKNTEKGSQASFKDQKCYMLNELVDGAAVKAGAEDKIKNVELIIKGEGADAKLAACTEATNEVLKANCAKCKVTDKVIATSTGCVASYTMKVDGIKVTLTGIVYNGIAGIEIDTSAIQ